MSGADYYDRPYTIVNSEINDMANRADRAIELARSIISQLAAFNVQISGGPPNLSLDFVDPAGQATIAPPDPTRFGEIGDIRVPALTPLDVGGLDGIEIDPGSFEAPYALQRPEAPPPIDLSGQPTRPDFGDVTIPAFDVDVSVPPLQGLDEIVVPAFEFPTLPVFNATAPEYDIAPPVTELQWSEPVYESEVLDDVKARVRAMLSGGTGLPPAIEAALFDRARARDDVASMKAEQDAVDAFAARGFDMPPGMLVKQLDAVREDNRLKAAANNREILIKATDVEIENLRFAVTQGIALEQLLINAFQNAAQRAFEAARFRVEADIRLHDSLVTAFNARQTAYQVEAQVYETRLRGELAKLDAYKAQLEGLKVRGELNQQKVAIFNALIEAMRGRIQAYVSRVEAAKAQTDVIRGRIDAYRADIQAYTERLNAQKVAFDAYESAVRAESALAQGNEAAARAFAATVQAQESAANVRIRVIQARIEALQAGVQRFTALLQAEQARVGAQRDVVQATAAAYGAEMQRYSAEIGRDTAGRQLEISRQEANLRAAISYYEINVRQYDAQLQRVIEVARLQQAGLDSAGRAAAQLAAGAMAAINVGASISGSASVSSNDSTSRSVNVTYEGEGTPPIF